MVSQQTSKVRAQTQPRSMVLVRWRRTRAVRYDTCSWCATGTILQEFVIRTAVRPIFASLLALQATGTTPFRVENASVAAWTGQSAWPVEAQGCVKITDVSTDAQGRIRSSYSGQVRGTSMAAKPTRLGARVEGIFKVAVVMCDCAELTGGAGGGHVQFRRAGLRGVIRGSSLGRGRRFRLPWGRYSKQPSSDGR